MDKSPQGHTVGFPHGCSTLFAGSFYTSYSESSNGQSKNAGKTLYFRLLAGVSRSRGLFVHNLDEVALWGSDKVPIDRPLFVSALPFSPSWTLPAKVEFLHDSKLLVLAQRMHTISGENFRRVSLNADSVLSVSGRSHSVP